MLWEVYPTRADAVAALTQGNLEPSPNPRPLPLEVMGPLSIEEFGSIVCIEYDWTTWTSHAEGLQSQLRALVKDFNRRNVILDLAHQEHIGSASISCFYALHHALSAASGRLALCNLSAKLLEFFRSRGDPLTFPAQSA